MNYLRPSGVVRLVGAVSELAVRTAKFTGARARLCRRKRIVDFTEKKPRYTRAFAGARQHELARLAGGNPDCSLPEKIPMCLARTYQKRFFQTQMIIFSEKVWSTVDPLPRTRVDRTNEFCSLSSLVPRWRSSIGLERKGILRPKNACLGVRKMHCFEISFC